MFINNETCIIVLTSSLGIWLLPSDQYRTFMPQTKESLISPRPPCVARLGIFAGYIFTIVHNIVWSLLVLLKCVHLNHRDAWEQVYIRYKITATIGMPENKWPCMSYKITSTIGMHENKWPWVTKSPQPTLKKRGSRSHDTANKTLHIS